MAEEREKQCQLCGASYQPKKYAYRQKYCGVECRERQRRIRKETERQVVLERHCLACGKAFRVESEANRRKFCNKLCGKKYHNDQRNRTTPTDKQCVACGVTFHCGNNTGGRKYCNDDCRERHYRDQAKKQRSPARQCVVCGATIQAGGRRKYCSDQCAGRYYSGQSKWDGKLTPAQRQGKKCLFCAAKIVQSKRALKLYCSAKCARLFRYYTSPEERADIRQQVREARPAKLSKKTFICKCCGKEFEGYERKKPVYCSQACSNTSHSHAGSGRQIETEEIRLSQSSAMHRAALDLRAAGKGASEIAALLDCRLTTVQS